jgi:hypothetical protein
MGEEIPLLATEGEKWGARDPEGDFSTSGRWGNERDPSTALTLASRGSDFAQDDMGWEGICVADKKAGT